LDLWSKAIFTILATVFHSFRSRLTSETNLTYFVSLMNSAMFEVKKVLSLNHWSLRDFMAFCFLVGKTLVRSSQLAWCCILTFHVYLCGEIVYLLHAALRNLLIDFDLLLFCSLNHFPNFSRHLCLINLQTYFYANSHTYPCA